MTTNPHTRAKQLLNLHGGSCFAPDGSTLINAFRFMEQAGAVTISRMYFGPVAGIEVQSKGYCPTVLATNNRDE